MTTRKTLRRLADVSLDYHRDGSPQPLTEQEARTQAAQVEDWQGFVAMRLRRAGWQIVLVQSRRRPWRRLVKRGVVRRPRSADLIRGMRLTDPMGHRAEVLAPYPLVTLRWQHLPEPVKYRQEPASTVWWAAA